MAGRNTDSIGWFSWVSGSFMNPLIGKKMTLENMEGIVISDKTLEVEANFEKFQLYWQQEQALASDKKKRKPSLRRALWRTFRKEFIVAGMLKLGWGFFILLSLAFFQRELLKAIGWRKTKSGSFVGSDSGILGAPDTRAYNTSWVLCCFFWLSCVILSICIQQMSACSTKIGLRMKSAVSTSIYRKALVHDKYQSHTDIVSLVAVDCTKLAEACTTLQFLWSGILEATAIMLILLGFVGVAALPGCAIMLLLLPFQYVTGIAISRMRKRVVEASDARVNLMDEILRAIKLVKMYAWERKFAETVGTLRAQETRLAQVGGWLKSMNLMVVFWLPPLIALSIFGVYVLTQILDSALAFTTLSLFNTLRLPLIQLPKSLRSLGEAMAATERIQSFLLSIDRELKQRAEGTQIVFDKACLTYGASQTALLKDITINVQKGSLAMVAGPVGSGKSNLLQAIMGQMKRLSGSERVGGNFAYVPQTPWCCHGTVRDNILFGKPYEERFYKHVLFACALETDLTLMEDGDMTQIGERGMNLSGGQKQRIALARAAYSGADTYLLDAPLSAVDMYTCVHIFKHCIKGIMMKPSTSVVLVTHQVELFVHATVLAVMKDGATQYVGPYDPHTVQQLFPTANITETSGLIMEKKEGGVIDALSRKISGDSGQKATLTRKISGESGPRNRTTTEEEPDTQPFERSASPTDADALNAAGPVKSRAKALRADLLQENEGKSSLAAPVAPKTVVNTSKASSGILALAVEMRWYLVLISAAIYVATQLCRIYSDIWISVWVARTGGKDQNYYVGIYGGYVAAFAVLLFMRGSFFFWMGGRAASRMHAKMFKSILKAPMYFFTVTPLGRVLSTFSKDMDCIDEMLLDEIHNLGFDIMILGTTIGVVIRVIPLFAIVVAVLGISFAYYFYKYMSTSQFLKDVAGNSFASVVASVSETLQGMDVILAYRAEDRFRNRNRTLMTTSSVANFNLEMLQLWLSFRLDSIGCLLVLGTCLLAVGLTYIPSQDAGLAVSNSFQILLFFALMVKGAAEVGCHISSVERLVELTKIPPEPDLPLSIETCPNEQWPAFGEVQFHDVVMSYAPQLPSVLKGVSFAVERSEKVGVVGRTGAGKSSLIMAIFRLADLSRGSIYIDGIDIGKLNLGELRRRIAIIPQEPVMFCGTLKSNLDPFGERTDEQLRGALEACLLRDMFQKHPDGLNQNVAHMGSNFSLGQQQLICLARAMLNPSKLLLLDEATAALDSDTDAAVQRVLRTSFADRTTITIAHRLDTIIDSDRILVMDAGKVAEFDSPYNLLCNQQTIFAQLCRQTGGQYETLRAAAERHHLCTQTLEAHVADKDGMLLSAPIRL